MLIITDLLIFIDSLGILRKKSFLRKVFEVTENKRLWCDRGDLNSHTRRALPPQCREKVHLTPKNRDKTSLCATTVHV